MKVSIKAIVLMGMAIAIFISPLSADGIKGEKEREKASLEAKAPVFSEKGDAFYFPEYTASMEAFWGEEELMHNTCSATSVMGGKANATCLNRQNCVCKTNWFVARCFCENVSPPNSGLTPSDP